MTEAATLELARRLKNLKGQEVILVTTCGDVMGKIARFDVYTNAVIVNVDNKEKPVLVRDVLEVVE
jgi:small nuclear ribonucleoprotein (snRNP)-like protein